jgi:hypothetical protein
MEIIRNISVRFGISSVAAEYEHEYEYEYECSAIYDIFFWIIDRMDGWEIMCGDE